MMLCPLHFIYVYSFLHVFTFIILKSILASGVDRPYNIKELVFVMSNRISKTSFVFDQSAEGNILIKDIGIRSDQL